MLGRAIWDKFPEYIFENSKIARVKRGQSQNFQKLQGWFIPKSRQNQTCGYRLITPNQETLFIK